MGSSLDMVVRRPLDITDDVREEQHSEWEEQKVQGPWHGGILGWRWKLHFFTEVQRYSQIQDLKEQGQWNTLKCGSGAVFYAYLLAK